MTTAGGSAFRHRDFTLFWVSLVTRGARAADGGGRHRLAGVLGLGRARSISGSIGLAEFLPLAAARASGRASRGPPAATELLTVMASSNAVVLGGLLAVTVCGQRARLAVLRARVRPGDRKRDRRTRRSCADAVARAAGDPRQRSRPALDRLPGLRGRRAGGRRHPLRDPARARLRRRDRPLDRRARVHARDAQRPGAGVRGHRRSRRGARGRSPDPAHERASGGDLARPVRGAPRRRRRAASDLREGHPRGRPDRARLPPCRARGRLAAVRARDHPLSDPAPCRADALRGRRRVRRLHDRLRPLADDVAVDARARAGRPRSTR